MSTGIVFRLDHRTRTASGGFVATRAGLECERACANNSIPRRCAGAWARRRARWSSPTDRVDLAANRRPLSAGRQRLDFYHAVQHLAAVCWALFGDDPARRAARLKPLAQQF